MKSFTSCLGIRLIISAISAADKFLVKDITLFLSDVSKASMISEIKDGSKGVKSVF